MFYRCLELGANGVIEVSDSPVAFSTAVIQANGGDRIDCILDCVGGSYCSENLECLAEDGRLVVYGLMLVIYNSVKSNKIFNELF